MRTSWKTVRRLIRGLSAITTEEPEDEKDRHRLEGNATPHRLDRMSLSSLSKAAMEVRHFPFAGSYVEPGTTYRRTKLRRLVPAYVFYVEISTHRYAGSPNPSVRAVEASGVCIAL